MALKPYHDGSSQTKVGINPWVAHANRSVYGEDADVFRPERWLEEGSMDGENKMEQYFFTVSAFDALLVFSNPATTTTRGAQNVVFLAQILISNNARCPTLSGRSNWCTLPQGCAKKEITLASTAPTLFTLFGREKTREERDLLTCIDGNSSAAALVRA